MELIIGNIDKLKMEMFKYLSSNIDEECQYKIIDNKISNKSGLFKSTHFDNIFYFASKNQNGYVEDIEKFLSIITSSIEHKSNKYVYILSGYYYNCEDDKEQLNFINEIFKAYRKKYECNIITVNIPCIYSNNYIDGRVCELIANRNDKRIKLNYSRQSKIDYIHIEDLAKLLFHIKTHNLEGISNLCISTNCDMNLGKLVSLINTKNSVSVVFGKETIENVTGEKLEFINHNFCEELTSCGFYKRIKKNHMNRLFVFKKLSDSIFKLVEVFLLAFLAHYMCVKFPITAQLQNIDIRLILIVFVALYFDLYYSILATILMCLSFVSSNLGSLSDLNVIFSNTNNWMIFIIYFVVTITVNERLYRVKKKLKLETIKNNKLLTNQQVSDFVIEHYEDVIIESNKLLIMGDGSYTKIENFIKDFIKNNMHIRKMYKSYIELLNTNNIALYEINDCKFKLINSKLINADIDYSSLDNINISEFINDDECIWVNRDLVPNRPSYIVPIYNNDKVYAVLTVWNCSLEQMNVEYEKMLISINNILSDFIKIQESEK